MSAVPWYMYVCVLTANSKWQKGRSQFSIPWYPGAAEPRCPGDQLTPTFSSARSICGVWPPTFCQLFRLRPPLFVTLRSLWRYLAVKGAIIIMTSLKRPKKETYNASLTAMGIGIPIGFPCMGMEWVWGLWWIPVGLWPSYGDLEWMW